MLKDEVESLFDPKNWVCSSPRHSNDMLYSSINQKLTKNTVSIINSENSNFWDISKFVVKSWSTPWNFDIIKKCLIPESNKTNENKYDQVQMNAINTNHG